MLRRDRGDHGDADTTARADAEVQRLRALQLGREMQAYAAQLKAKADELKEILEHAR